MPARWSRARASIATWATALRTSTRFSTETRRTSGRSRARQTRAQASPAPPAAAAFSINRSGVTTISTIQCGTYTVAKTPVAVLAQQISCQQALSILDTFQSAAAVEHQGQAMASTYWTLPPPGLELRAWRRRRRLHVRRDPSAIQLSADSLSRHP